ncbi:RNA polymerase sigma factor [Candidatus Entotheonella palauensis]|uniref:RNA polymerase sigma factor n=1 Tax=Candidatus Entotheonella gemina TaxID=1429439 RepID=W4LRB2_9BACT|nr:sigma-70 family RNA polymerase sigma factor [Candidatus Entotheonella palauensis]ETX00410.1 MAG: hypothetical protein ETSY2_39130 [Candidatus Entotheonella gemina]
MSTRVLLVDVTTSNLSRPTHLAAISAAPAASQPEDDVSLMRRVAAQDHEAFHTLYTRHAPRLHGYLLRVLGQPELADEALNDVMLVMWQRAAYFDTGSSLLAWLIGIARKKAWKAMARASSPNAGPARQEVLDEETPETVALRQEYDDLLIQAMDTLSPSHRIVLELLVYQGYSYKDIAKQTGRPLNTVKTQVFRARSALAARLAVAA